MAIVPIKNHSSKGQALCVCRKHLAKNPSFYPCGFAMSKFFLLYLLPLMRLSLSVGGVRVQKYHQLKKNNKFFEL